MKIVAVGLNHKSAPIDIREKLYFSSDQAAEVLRQLKRKSPGAEFVLLSTCNRVELYCACKRANGLEHEDLARFLADFRGTDLNEFHDLLYFYSNEDVVRHLLTVACGLDSMVLGEDQILGQAKDGYRTAVSVKSTGKVLNRLFHCAFFTSKKVHANTAVSEGRISAAGVAVELAKKLFDKITKSKTVVIGAGEMGELLVKHLLHVGCTDITVINRSYERGRLIAQRRGIKAAQWDELNDNISDADIVVSSASAQEYLFDKPRFQQIMQRRPEKSLLLIDISVPRNFEPDVEQIRNVHLYSIDELSSAARENLKMRQDDIAGGLQIISEETNDFMAWFEAIEVGPLIGKMKQQFGLISRNELDRFLTGKRQEAPCREVLETMVHRIVNKLLHCVISNVEMMAKNESPNEAARLVQDIVEQAERISSETEIRNSEKLKSL